MLGSIYKTNVQLSREKKEVTISNIPFGGINININFMREISLKQKVHLSDKDYKLHFIREKLVINKPFLMEKKNLFQGDKNYF